MTILYLVVPLALVIAGGAVAAFAWTVRSGQLDDLDTPPRRILFDDARAARAPRAGVAPGPAPIAGVARSGPAEAAGAGTPRE